MQLCAAIVIPSFLDFSITLHVMQLCAALARRPHLKFPAIEPIRDYARKVGREVRAMERRILTESEAREMLHGEWSDTFKESCGFRPRCDVSHWTALDFSNEIESLRGKIAENSVLPASGNGWAYIGDEAALTICPLCESPMPADRSCDCWDNHCQ